MNTPFVVRSIALDDHAAWRPLWDGYNAFYGRSGPTALAESVTEVLWSRLFDPAEPVHGLVAMHGERVVGIVHYLFHRSTTRIQPVCYLQDLFTQADRRGQGVGRALIEGVDAAARASGASRVYWLTHSSNDAGRALYDQVATHAGFIVYSRELS